LPKRGIDALTNQLSFRFCAELTGLLVFLRIWRVSRIVNRITDAMRAKYLLKLKKARRLYDRESAKRQRMKQAWKREQTERQQLEAHLHELQEELQCQVGRRHAF
jgi:hypothetical protein